jgi:glyoxylase-like metal-dependent hydrolase (beta-lactamase superfamily II)
MSYISAEAYLHEADLSCIRELNSFAGPYAPPENISPLVELSEGGKIAFGGFGLKIIHVPGHTPGSIALFEEKGKLLFSGDTLFAGGGVGRADLPLGNEKELKRSLEKLGGIKRKKLCPGHGPAE